MSLASLAVCTKNTPYLWVFLVAHVYTLIPDSPPPGSRTSNIEYCTPWLASSTQWVVWLTSELSAVVQLSWNYDNAPSSSCVYLYWGKEKKRSEKIRHSGFFHYETISQIQNDCVFISLRLVEDCSIYNKGFLHQAWEKTANRESPCREINKLIHKKCWEILSYWREILSIWREVLPSLQGNKHFFQACSSHRLIYTYIFLIHILAPKYFIYFGEIEKQLPIKRVI